jgi:hypothetical protein
LLLKKGRLILAVLFSVWIAPLRAQISPGALSTAHGFLSGPSNCTRCHDLAKGSPSFNCLNCHQEISRRLDERRGLHPSLTGGDRTGHSCASCHSEHNGRNFALVRWDTPLARFDHRRAGYALEGKHATLSCKSCHEPGHLSPERSPGIMVKDPSRTWLGLSPKCSGCHADEHRGQLSPDCANCHNSTRWKDAAQFNHDRSRFILSGAHQSVACQKCHTKADDPKPFTRYRDLSFSDCTPCHADPHKGAFRQSCQSCHQPQRWKIQQPTSLFNHGSTRFALEGKHASLGCPSCHTGADFKSPVPHARCTDCHKKDPHRGEFSLRADGGDCSACHKVGGFTPTTFTLESHATSRFPLQGKHESLACARCHRDKNKMPVYRFESLDCKACHVDSHGGQFSASPLENKCEACHTVQGFVPSSFSLSRHRQSRFPLTGAHGAVLCRECHKRRTDIYPQPPVAYLIESGSCTDCHRDPHNGDLASRMAVLREDGRPVGCEACHRTSGWKEIHSFDHDSTSFLLRGAHKSAACESCHKTANLRAGLHNVSFKSAPRQCSGCHDDVHGGQFAAAVAAPDCGRCHGPLKWKPSLFDHDRDSGYRLSGAHRNVPCAMCHRATREISGRTVVMYNRTSHECRDCHAGQTGGK